MKGGGLSNLGAVLIAVFVVCVVILVADLFYVLWRRRRFHRRSISSGDSVFAGEDDSNNSLTYVLSSKELLYFFCWKDQSRVEPNESSKNTNHSVPDPDTQNPADQDDDVLKLNQGVYGPSRLLFTIKEEEEAERQEGLDHHNLEKIMESTSPPEEEVEKESTTSTEEEVSEDVAVSVMVEVDEATPFSTPCASPPYYTPPPSPSREDQLKQFYNSHENGGREVKVPFVSLEIIGV